MTSPWVSANNFGSCHGSKPAIGTSGFCHDFSPSNHSSPASLGLQALGGRHGLAALERPRRRVFRGALLRAAAVCRGHGADQRNDAEGRQGSGDIFFLSWVMVVSMCNSTSCTWAWNRVRIPPGIGNRQVMVCLLLKKDEFVGAPSD